MATQIGSFRAAGRNLAVRVFGLATRLVAAIRPGPFRLPGQPLFHAFGLYKGIYIGGIAMRESTAWEMHPDGDEVLTLVSGKVRIVLDEQEGARECRSCPDNRRLFPKAFGTAW